MASHSPASSCPPSLHRSKRLKTLIANSSSTIKGQTDQEEQYNSKDVCGICLADYGQAVSGELDCCNHFFCFVCIMMWAKIESRCPTCKRRFTTIRRPPKPGVFPAERIVYVPKRDQVYHPLGNMSIGPFDPYAEVGCRVCNSSVDECFLLLCDLCDSAAHTYCVGLGTTVPEGDWFCHECEVSRAERENNTIDNVGNLEKFHVKEDGDGMVVVVDEPCVSGFNVVDNQHNLEDSGGVNDDVPFFDIAHESLEVSRAERKNNAIPIDDNAGNHVNLYMKDGAGMVVVADEPSVSRSNFVDNQHNFKNSVDDVNGDISIFDIVRESDTPLFGSQRPKVSPPPVPRARQRNLEDQVIKPVERSPPTALTQTSARTLSRCRNVNSYIQALRENWDALQTGSLCFSSSAVESRSNGFRKRKSDAVLRDSSDQSHSSPSTSGPQLRTWDGFPGFTNQDRQSQDINRAWKMMDRAKSIIHQSSKSPSGKGNLSEGETNRGLSLHLSKNEQLGTRKLGKTTTEKQYRRYYLEKQTEKNMHPKFEKKRQSNVMTKEIVGSSDSLSATTCSQISASISSCKAKTSSRGDVCQVNKERILQKNLCQASLHVTNEQNRSSYLTTLVGSAPGASDPLKAKPELSASFSCKINVPEVEVRLAKRFAKSKARNDNAKSEVQSLVKLNLKLLSRDKHLQVDAFKEIARLATHTILAACGLGHSRYVIHSFPSSVCSHSEQIQQIRKSTLMPNSCRECFFVFVKDVVNSILSEKVCPAES